MSANWRCDLLTLDGRQGQVGHGQCFQEGGRRREWESSAWLRSARTLPPRAALGPRRLHLGAQRRHRCLDERLEVVAVKLNDVANLVEPLNSDAACPFVAVRNAHRVDPTVQQLFCMLQQRARQHCAPANGGGAINPRGACSAVPCALVPANDQSRQTHVGAGAYSRTNDAGGAISDLVVLGLAQLHKELSNLVLHVHLTQDGGCSPPPRLAPRSRPRVSGQRAFGAGPAERAPRRTAVIGDGDVAVL